MTPNVGRDVEPRKLLLIAGGARGGAASLEDNWAVLFTKLSTLLP